MEKKLYRDEFRKVVAGVCAGLSEYFDIDVSIIRVIFLLCLLLKGGGVLIYIVLWIVLPKKGLARIPNSDSPIPPYTGSGFQDNAPAYQQPPFIRNKKNPSTGALIGGLIMIMLGAGFLLDQFKIIPDWDFEDWWPLILVVVGLVLIFSHRNQPQPAHFEPWKPVPHPPATETPASDPLKDDNNADANPVSENPTEPKP
ncbi:PspC domain-containing protein [Mucilaginibacter ginkgonis]|uniref:PspC domain-containing protein n=1 Tax=Mucilaginibacter ginkgonis TaxID=2682091 RepID=A0A6I4I2F6_9SPHI|nr:PspC domain-containing protein [Mucilaginibacter ginkgonis]QQL49170.1 PspC domain-containing protein [Mucilaginibacter ginkgonis]